MHFKTVSRDNVESLERNELKQVQHNKAAENVEQDMRSQVKATTEMRRYRKRGTPLGGGSCHLR